MFKFTLPSWLLKVSIDSFTATMISTMAWNDNANMLAAVADNKVTFWYYPSVAFVDPDIIPKTLLQKDEKYVAAIFLLLKLLIFTSQ